MENEIATVPQGAITTFNFFDKEQFETMQRVCKLFASSELVPDMYKTSDTNPENKAMANCMIAIEMSQRIGASPLMIMQNMVIIYGRPSWSSKFLIATVNTCGRFNPLQYKITNLGRLGKVSYTTYNKTWIPGKDGKKGYYKTDPVTSEFDGTQIDNLQCIAFTTAKGSKEILESSPVDIKMAIQEGWYLKAGSKWPTMARQMLQYRAASFWTNAYAPELSMGMKTEEELRDIIDVDYVDVTTKVGAEKEKEANKVELNIDEAGTADKKAENSEPTKQGEAKVEPDEKPKVDPKSAANPGELPLNQSQARNIGF